MLWSMHSDDTLALPLQIVAETPRLRGLLALNGAFGVLLECASRDGEKGAGTAELALQALVDGKTPIKKVVLIITVRCP